MTNPTTDTRRRVERTDITSTIRVFDDRTGVHLGELNDLSLDGMGLTIAWVEHLNRPRTFRLEIPEDLHDSFECTELLVEGQGVWIRPMDQTERHNFGVRFLHLSEEQQDVIRTLTQVCSL